MKCSSLLTDCPRVLSSSDERVCGQEKKEGYLTHGVDALTEASDEGRRRLR